MTNTRQDTGLPPSLRKFIRERKRQIRDEFGEQSEQEKKLRKWVESQKDEKRKRIAPTGPNRQ